MQKEDKSFMVSIVFLVSFNSEMSETCEQVAWALRPDLPKFMHDFQRSFLPDIVEFKFLTFSFKSGCSRCMRCSLFNKVPFSVVYMYVNCLCMLV